MTLEEKIKADTKEAMIAKDSVRTTTLRGVSAVVLNEALAKKTGKISDDDVIAIIKRLVKQRKDSIEQFTKGGRPELAKTEAVEQKILEAYLPASTSKADIKKVAETLMKKLDISDLSTPELRQASKKKMGQLIGAVNKELKGKADGADIKEVVEGLLNS